MALRQIIGYNLLELKGILSGLGHNPKLAREICISIYRRRLKFFSEMEALPQNLRQKLNKEFTISTMSPENIQESVDGTLKYLFRTSDGQPFETAYMPVKKRKTLCISTQSGCRMGCDFCHTGKLGFNSNLSAGEIIGQLMGVNQSVDVNRIVLMGMGEPLDNLKEVIKALEILTSEWGFAFGASNITLSSVGILPELKEIVDLKRCNIAISLHSPWHDVREKLMPIERIHTLSEILFFLRENPIKKPLRLSFEYMVIPGINDSPEDAAETARILGGLNAHVNVMSYNSNVFFETSNGAAKKFRDLLSEQGQPATLRLSRGNDIAAACGMLAAKY